jgi:hypothetical protein
VRGRRRYPASARLLRPPSAGQHAAECAQLGSVRQKNAADDLL